MEIQVKVWQQILLTWHKKTLRIRDNDFQIEKVGKKKISKTYSLFNAVLVDQSKNNDLQILIGTSSYKVYIKPLSKEDKEKIISKFEEKIKQISSKTTFSNDYMRYNEELLSSLDNSQFGLIITKLNIFQNLMLEMAQKLDNFKTLIQTKHGTITNYMTIHNNLMIIKEEMKKKFDEIVSSLYNYHDQIEGPEANIVNKRSFDFKEGIRKGSDFSSSEEDVDIESNINIEENLRKNLLKREEKNEIKLEEKQKDNKSKVKEGKEIIIDEPNKNIKKNPYYFLSEDEKDFNDKTYNFNKRKNLPHKIVCPKNMIKDIVTNMTKNYLLQYISMSLCLWDKNNVRNLNIWTY